jgi:hypothetical protein
MYQKPNSTAAVIQNGKSASPVMAADTITLQFNKLLISYTNE